MKKTIYLKVIQGNYGQGWEDLEEMEVKSTGLFKSKSDEIEYKKLLREYKLMRYPIRSISRKKRNPQGLKAPASKGLTTLCAMNVGVTGRRKKDGTQKKGYIAKKGGKLVKKSTKTRKVKL